MIRRPEGGPAADGPRRARSRIGLTLLVVLGVSGLTAEAQQSKGRTPARKAASVGAAWKVQVDPPAEPLKLPDGPGYTIPVPSGDGALFPTTPSNFVALGKNEGPADVRQVFDLRTREVVGEIRGKQDFSDEVKLSPDGQYLLAEHKGGPPSGPRSIAVWSFETGQVAKTFVASPTPAFIGLLGFAKGNLAVTSRYIGKGDMISLWDVSTGKLAREILAPPSFKKESVAFSPGGRYLALVSNDPQLLIADLTTVSLAGQAPIPKGKALYIQPVGLTFSPDGTELAGLFTAAPDTRLMVWDVASGKVVVEHTIKGDPKNNVLGAGSYKGRPIEWLPDGSAWLLYGHTLVDRAHGRPVWTFRGAKGDYEIGQRIMADNDRMLTVNGKRGNHWIEVVTLPWPKVDASLKAIEAKAPAHVRPGQPVSLKVDVDAVRFGNAEEVRAALTQTLTERLAAEGIPVAPGQPAVLHARYGEAEGKTLNEVKGRGPLPGFGGTPTGRTIQATKAGCEIAWEVPGLGSVWSDRIDFDPSNLMVRGEATDAKAREAAFGALRHTLNGLAIPYFLPKGGGLATLPGVTVIASDAAPPAANRATVKKTTRGQGRLNP